MRDSVSGRDILRIRGGRGLGDSIYVRPIAEHFVKQGASVLVLTDHPLVFLGSGVPCRPFERIKVDVTAHYVGYKRQPGTTQWEDVCASSGIPTIPLRFNWEVRNHTMISGLKAQAGGRPMVLVHGGRRPMGRMDGFGMELLPRKEAFDAVLRALRDCFLIQVGRADEVYPLRAEVNLNGNTTVADLLDLGRCCAGVVAQCSFAIPLAEVFDKPLLAIWGAGISTSREPFVRSTTPIKVLSAPRDRFVMDDWDPEVLRDCALQWLSEGIRLNGHGAQEAAACAS